MAGSIIVDNINGYNISVGQVLCSAGQTLATNGYQKLSNGLIIQWGIGTASASTSGTATGVTYPISFPNAVFATHVQLKATGIAGTSDAVVNQTSNSGFTWYRQNNSNVDSFRDYSWFAIGY